MSRPQVLLFSAGLDSFIIWHLLDRPRAVYYPTGAANEAQELARISSIIDALDYNERTIGLGVDLGLGDYEKPDGFVPFRNLSLIMRAALDYPGYDIVIGQVAEWQVDKNASFYRLVSRLIRQHARGTGRVVAPFAGWTKSRLVGEYLRRGHSAADLVRLTYSCLAGGAVGCGRCSSCLNRWVAFTNNGIHGEPLEAEPTWAAWLANARAQRRLFHPARLGLYIVRWFEAWCAFNREA